jgi:type IV secretory pathway VirB3-like protein
MNENLNQEDGLLRLRQGGQVRQMDLATLVTLIQQNAVERDAEVNSLRLTQGEWRKLSTLDVYRDFGRQTASAPVAAIPQPPVVGEPGDAHEQNLRKFFSSLAIAQLRIDSTVALISGLVTALLSIVVHRSVLIVILMVVGWGVAYLLADQVLFPRWIQQVRRAGFQRLPWQSRSFLIIAIVVPGYFLVASFLPLLPAEGFLSAVDAVIGLLLSGASGVIWTFRLDAQRAKKAFELSSQVAPK